MCLHTGVSHLTVLLLMHRFWPHAHFTSDSVLHCPKLKKPPPSHSHNIKNLKLSAVNAGIAKHPAILPEGPEGCRSQLSGSSRFKFAPGRYGAIQILQGGRRVTLLRGDCWQTRVPLRRCLWSKGLTMLHKRQERVELDPILFSN